MTAQLNKAFVSDFISIRARKNDGSSKNLEKIYVGVKYVTRTKLLIITTKHFFFKALCFERPGGRS